MPRTIHPRSRHSHSRAHVRFHRDRVVRARGRAYRSLRTVDLLEDNRLAGPWGYLEDEHAWLGCRRAHCGLCHPDKRWHRTADRMADGRAWRELEDAAW